MGESMFQRTGLHWLYVLTGLFAIASNTSMAGKINLGEDEKLVAQDTFPLGEYRAVEYFKCNNEGYNTSMGNVMIIYKGDKEVLSIDEGGTGFVNICGQYTAEKDTCYFSDINRDSVDETIVDIFTGGANCCFTMRVYALKDSLEELLNLDAVVHGSDLVDIDNDSIPEFVTWDNRWAFWQSENTSWKAYLPRIVWRWDGHKYKIANFRFSDYLIKLFNLDSYKTPSKDSSRIMDICGEIDMWDFMINNYYAGRADLADSIFNACWPSQDTMKLKIFEEFQHRLRSSEYWPQVLESKW
jgi:hypothetical protein